MMHSRRLNTFLLVAGLLAIIALLGAGPAVAAPGDSGEHAVSLNDYLGSSITTNLVTLASGQGTATTGYYYFKVALQPRETLCVDFLSGVDFVNMKALVQGAGNGNTGAVPARMSQMTPGLTRLVFASTQSSIAMYTVYLGTSRSGAFMAQPIIISPSYYTTSYYAPWPVETTVTVMSSAITGVPVHLYASSNGISGWTRTSTTVSETAPGHYLALPKVRTASYFRLGIDYADLGAVQYQRPLPAAGVVRLYPQVNFTTAPKSSTYTHHYGRYYSVYGYVNPYHATTAGRVKLLAERRGSRIGTDLAGAAIYSWYAPKSYTCSWSYYTSGTTKYKYSLKLPYKGVWRVRAFHAADTANATTYSPYRTITVVR